jgi:hypothetical protein
MHALEKMVTWQREGMSYGLQISAKIRRALRKKWANTGREAGREEPKSYSRS